MESLGQAVQAAKEILPVPATTDPEQVEISHSLAEKPTISHELAMAEPEEKGAAQIEHEAEVIDLGWNENPKDISNPLVGGLSNEDLWVLVRRFNKVRSTPLTSTLLSWTGLIDENRKCTISRRQQNPFQVALISMWPKTMNTRRTSCAVPLNACT
jgi:hypothetical protein